jgi:hypothetical protein
MMNHAGLLTHVLRVLNYSCIDSHTVARPGIQNESRLLLFVALMGRERLGWWFKLNYHEVMTSACKFEHRLNVGLTQPEGEAMSPTTANSAMLYTCRTCS